MNKKARLWIPLVLILAVIIAACVYFLYFRTDLTAGFLIYWGDHFERVERYNRSIACYRLATKFAPDDESIPINLAEVYTKSGNYTKAEYTLVQAITADPDSTELYIALSKTYVAQDKLMDAEQMLNRIRVDSVKGQIDNLRPEAPVIVPESGYYSDYIEISVEDSVFDVYLTSDGIYPSVEDDLYEQPFTISGGETTIIAVAVGSNGLVSTASYAGYTVGNVVEEVTIQDPALDTCIRDLLGIGAYDTLYSDQLWDIEELELPEGVASLDDLHLFAGLRSLSLHKADNLDLTALSQSTTLQQLDLSGCILSSAVLDAIGTLPDLTQLNLSSCAISNINSLVGLTKLQQLDLSGNSITDITALSSMENLQELNLAKNPIDTIVYLNNCLNLRLLNIENCKVAKLSSLAGNTSLEELYAAHNAVEDISVLVECPAIRVLDVSFNKVKDASVLAQLPALTIFLGESNQLEALPKLNAEESPLQQINVNKNQIADLSGLSELQWLNYIYADYNKVEDLSCLEKCSCLVQVDVWNNPVDEEQISKLQDMGVIVNYNPTYEPEPEPEEEKKA